MQESGQDIQRRYEAAKRMAQEIQSRIERSAGRLDAAKKQYADLVNQAKEKYGVSSLAELEALASRYESENLAALEKFEQEAAAVRADLEKVESALEEAGV